MTPRPVFPAIAAFVLLAGCATIQTSPLNPFNWFGRGPAPATVEDAAVAYVPPALVPLGREVAPDPRRPIERVLSVSLDRSPDAILVTAEGQTSAAGHYNAALVPTAIEGGYLILEFRAEPPPVAVSGQPRLTSGYVLDNSMRAGLRGLRIVTRQNAITRSF